MRPGDFLVEAKDSTTRARAGLLATTHGRVLTPVFMPVGTQATVKALPPALLKEMGTQILLSNTYHLHLRPGEALIEAAGGLHDFMSWDRPILTDSGGFQLFSLEGLTKVTDAGVEFSSHIDGERLFLGPEEAIAIQERLGADIIMAFDQPVKFPCSQFDAELALDRTTLWAQRCRQAHRREHQLLFGIVQGGFWEPLRLKSAAEITALDFPGYAIGGLSVGEPNERMYEVLDYTCPALPEAKPRYLMGVGTPEDLLEAVARGVDMFDCVLPTRLGRTGAAFTHEGRVSLKAARQKESSLPIDPECDCATCRQFSRAYLRHLFWGKEILASILTSYHNVYFLLKLMETARQAIWLGRFEQFSEEFLARYRSGADVEAE